MQPNDDKAETGSPELKYGAAMGAAILLGLFAAAWLSRTTGDMLSAIVLVLVFLISVAAILAPRGGRSRSTSG